MDSISFSTPTAIFPTSNVFFDLRITPDVGVPAFTGYEINIYFEEYGVGIVHAADFLIRISASFTHMPGDDLSAGATSTLLYYDYDVPFGFFTSDQDTLSSTLGSSASTIPEPGALAILGLGLIAAGAARRRRAV